MNEDMVVGRNGENWSVFFLRVQYEYLQVIAHQPQSVVALLKGVPYITREGASQFWG